MKRSSIVFWAVYQSQPDQEYLINQKEGNQLTDQRFLITIKGFYIIIHGGAYRQF